MSEALQRTFGSKIAITWNAQTRELTVAVTISEALILSLLRIEYEAGVKEKLGDVEAALMAAYDKLSVTREVQEHLADISV